MAGDASRQNGKKGGRPPGAQNLSTISKEQAREALRQIVLREMDAMVAAQVAHSKGIKYLVKRARVGGKFEKVSEEELDAVLKGQDDGSIILEVWDKDPSVQAFTDLMNRALDKPKEQQIDLNITHDEAVVKRLAGARARGKRG